ncbi:Transcription factor 25 [Terramyces sp. JEL0728]|nr:Transcription factor 25 [Terramyces sp. JEL0728]
MRKFRKLNKEELQEESEEEIIYNEKKVNLFELLEDQSVPETEEPPVHIEETPEPATKRKTKKKNKPAKKQAEEDIDSIIKEINDKFGKVDTITVHKDITLLWKFDLKSLDYITEMKRRFGAAVEMQKIGKRKLIVSPKLSWPKVSSYVSMEILECDPLTDVKVFTLVHSEDYQSLQKQFFNAIETHDPNAIFYILQQYPFHFSALLQMSEVCKQNGDMDSAFEYIEKSVFAFEKSASNSFKINGKARLNYDRVENRPVYFALFKYIQFLSRKAKSTEFLEVAIAKFPSVVKGIYEKLEIYDPIVQDDFFREESNTFLKFLIALHIENIYYIWKVPELQEWLKSTTKKVYDEYQLNGLQKHSDEKIKLQKHFDALEQLPLNCQRLVILSDASNFLTYLPKGAMETLLSFDPFPPETAVNGPYEYVYQASQKPTAPSIVGQLGNWIGRLGDSLFGQNE